MEQRWVAQLASYDFVVKYRAGRENGNVDSLSRLSVPPTEQNRLAEVQQIDVSGGATALGALGIDEWREAQQGDEDLQLVMQHVRSAGVPTTLERRA